MAYDNTCKWIAEAFSRDIATWLVGTAMLLAYEQLTDPQSLTHALMLGIITAYIPR